MESTIIKIQKGSPADGRKIFAGDRLVRINGHKIYDVLDYKFYAYDSKLLLELHNDAGVRFVKIIKEPGEDLGLEFETYLMDKAKSCANKCVFCFVDQLPRGMRKTLYFKDDDARLSFLQGNYITLTNLAEREFQRIMDLHISPFNVSVHAADPEMRCFLLGNKNAGKGIEMMRRLKDAGIIMNCQIVCCPGLNDGDQLLYTMQELEKLYPEVNSVSVVPVGLTKHREGLYPLKPFDKAQAGETIDLVESFGKDCLKKHGSQIFFCADELYLKAQRSLPDDDWYEGYPQLENGVGLIRLLITEFEESYMDIEPKYKSFTVATGVSAALFIEELYKKAKIKYPALNGQVIPVVNDFFGHTIDVAGLVTGGDIIKQLKGKEIGDRLLIPRNMLRHGEGVFLDDTTIEDLEEELGVPVRVVEQDGTDLAKAFLGL